MNPIDKAIRDAQAVVISAQNLKIQQEIEIAMLRKKLADAEAKLRDTKSSAKAVA